VSAIKYATGSGAGLNGQTQCFDPQCNTYGQRRRTVTKGHVCTEAFIKAWSNVCSSSQYDVGCTNIIPHRINTSDNVLHFEQLRHHPTMQLPLIDEHVENMLQHDVIELAASP